MGTIPEKGWKIVFEIKNKLSGFGEVKDVSESKEGLSVHMEMDKDFTQCLADEPSSDVYLRMAIPPKCAA